MNIYLTGFMGAGKSAVGRCLARQLKRPFVDLDAEIERRCGRSVAELLSRGERTFRRLESQVFRSLSKRSNTVVALGGGTLLSAGNRRLARGSGAVVSLRCAEPELWRRLKGGAAARPLLRQGRPGMHRLLARRRSLYRRAGLVVSTTRRKPSQAAAIIARCLT